MVRRQFSLLKHFAFMTVLHFGYTESLENLALGKEAYQTDTYGTGNASKAVDGGLAQTMTSGSCTHTSTREHAYWEVDLGLISIVKYVKIYNRLDGQSYRLTDVQLYIGMGRYKYNLVGYIEGELGSIYTFYPEKAVIGRWLRITRLPSAPGALSLCEVQVYGLVYKSVLFRTYPSMTGNGEDIKILATKSQLHCTHTCLKLNNCVATNYIESNKQCELKSSFSDMTTSGGSMFILKN